MVIPVQKDRKRVESIVQPVKRKGTRWTEEDTLSTGVSFQYHGKMMERSDVCGEE